MMKIFKIANVLFMATFIFLFACSKKKPPEPELPKYKWTILGYFDGNNSQDRAPDGNSYVINDLQELEQIGSTEDVQILVMLGSFKTEGHCKYYHVKTDSSEVVDSLGKKDMSHFTTLRDFISYGMENYSAEHYMLIINDHGAGWKGICYDTIEGASSWMSLPDLSSALSGFEFDIIWFYAPSMATAEVAYQIKDRADYMIASQFKLYPDNIMGSTEWLSDLTNEPERKVRGLATIIVRSVYKAAQKISTGKHVHIALIDLHEVSQLATDISSLSRDLIGGNGSYWAEAWDAWASSARGFFDYESSFVDLRQFAYEIAKSNLDSVIRKDATLLESSVNRAVIADTSKPISEKIGGICIYLPWKQDDFDPTGYGQLDFSETGWHNFIPAFIQHYSDSYAGILDIKSDPTGARVYLNDVYTGYETNAIIRGIFPDVYTIKLSKDGCKDLEKTGVHINPHDSVDVGTLKLDCSP